MKRINSDENKITGHWHLNEGNVEKDINCKRIDYLTINYLTEVSTSEDGWSKLYIDKNDGRYWELVYNDSSFHGGGPPSLIALNEKEVLRKYPSVK